MTRRYRDGWEAVFGTGEVGPSPIRNIADDAGEDPAKKPRRETQTIDASDIDWANTRALSVRQPYAELIMRSDKETEYRSGPTRIRGRIAIYASLSKDDLGEASYHGLDPEQLPRGVIVGTVELHSCSHGDWQLRRPMRFVEPIKPTKHPQPVWFYPFGRRDREG